jgi:cysteinyl-tRNA synthetase
MAEELLGVDFDIHGGGSDLVFPHHENEAAQTAAARGKPLARLWVHNGMLQLGEEKMAKSVGNIAPLHEVLAAHDRDAVILYFLGGHYRQPLAFSPELLEEADRGIHRIRDAMRRLTKGPSPDDMTHLKERFFAALREDFNTPKALAALFDWIREANRRESVGDADLREMLEVLALDNLTPLESVADPSSIDPEAAALLDRRERARADRDFSEADRLRDEIHARGWEIRDGPEGPELIPSSE